MNTTAVFIINNCTIFFILSELAITGE